MVSLKFKGIVLYIFIFLLCVFFSIALYLLVYSDSSNDEFLVISDQSAVSTIIVDKLVASKPSFLVVRRIGDSFPGAYLIPEGTHGEIEVGLQEGAVAVANFEKGTYFAGLHEDSNLNGIYDNLVDRPVLNKKEKPVTVKFKIE